MTSHLDTKRNIAINYEPSESIPEMAMGKDLNTGEYIVEFKFFGDELDD